MNQPSNDEHRLARPADLRCRAWRGRPPRRRRTASQWRGSCLTGSRTANRSRTCSGGCVRSPTSAFRSRATFSPEIAAGALDVAGATRATPLSLSGATERHLPEWTVSGNTARQKHRAAFQAAIALHGGIIVDYQETAGWWQIQDYTFHAFDAVVVLIRVAADHTGRSVRSVCEEIAARCGEP